MFHHSEAPPNQHDQSVVPMARSHHNAPPSFADAPNLVKNGGELEMMAPGQVYKVPGTEITFSYDPVRGQVNIGGLKKFLEKHPDEAVVASEINGNAGTEDVVEHVGANGPRDTALAVRGEEGPISFTGDVLSMPATPGIEDQGNVGVVGEGMKPEEVTFDIPATGGGLTGSSVAPTETSAPELTGHQVLPEPLTSNPELTGSQTP